MDEEMMNKWIGLVLIPWRNIKAPGIIPHLILDAFCIHVMGNIMNGIQSLGIEVACICVCQLM
jgi:hypothetical protein